MKQVIGRINPEDKKVTIWGAGFSGLVLGYYLKEQGYQVTILEKSHRIGGKIHTKKTSAGLVELGANALYMNADVMDLLKELKLEPLPATKKLRRLILNNGKPKKAVQFGALARIALFSAKQPPLVSDGLTVADFLKPLLGPEILGQIVSPALSGIYAAPADQLHFKSVFPQVSHMAQFDSYWHFFRHLIKEQKSRPRLEVSGSVSFDGGMQTLIDRLGELLKKEIKLNHKEKFQLKSNTIICTDALSAAELIKHERPTLSAELSRIKYQSLSSVTVFMKREIRSLQRAFGVLIPLKSGFNSIGVINQKAIFPINNENVSAYTFISKNKLSSEEILTDVKLLYSDFVSEDIVKIENTWWERALPVYDLQRYLCVKKLHQLAKPENGLAFFGNYVAGISLREMVSTARRFARNPIEDQELK